MLITFSGLDGAGKSTLIGRLKESLEKQDRRVTVSHMYRDVGIFACVKFMLERMGRGGAWEGADNARRTEQGSARKGKVSVASRLKSAIVWNRPLRLCIYPLDLLIFLGYRWYVEVLKRHVLIMDRYFYDTLVDVDAGNNRRGLRLLSQLAPLPSVPVYLDITPETAHSRKGEFTIEYLTLRRSSYEKLFACVPNLVVLDTDGEMEATLCHLERAVFERITA